MVVCATQKAMRNLHLERDEISDPPSARGQGKGISPLNSTFSI